MDLQNASSLRKRAEVSGLNRATMREEQARLSAFFEGEAESIITLQGDLRINARPKEWALSITDTWLLSEVTRRSQDRHHEMRNPHDRSDRTRYRYHLLETRLSNAVQKIVALLKLKFTASYPYQDGVLRPAGFTASYTYVLKHKPFNVKQFFGRIEICLCRSLSLSLSLSLVHGCMYVVHVCLCICMYVSREHVGTQNPLILCCCMILGTTCSSTSSAQASSNSVGSVIVTQRMGASARLFQRIPLSCAEHWCAHGRRALRTTSGLVCKTRVRTAQISGF